MGGPTDGVPREEAFDITPASEVMAILSVASDLDDLHRRLGDVIVGFTPDIQPVTCRDLEVDGAMTVLLKNAICPNLAQTSEGGPAFVHGGPFANIALGCNSIAATRASLSAADITVTEAGFGSDLGAEKFFNVVSRIGGFQPQIAVIVATVRAIKRHGGRDPKQLEVEDLAAWTKECPTWTRISTMWSATACCRCRGQPLSSDTSAELEAGAQPLPPPQRPRAIADPYGGGASAVWTWRKPYATVWPRPTARPSSGSITWTSPCTKRSKRWRGRSTGRAPSPICAARS